MTDWAEVGGRKAKVAPRAAGLRSTKPIVAAALEREREASILTGAVW